MENSDRDVVGHLSPPLIQDEIMVSLLNSERIPCGPCGWERDELFFVMFISTVAGSIRIQVKCRNIDGGYSSHLSDALL